MAACYRFPNAERCANCGWNQRTNSKTRYSVFGVRVGELPAAERQLVTSWLPSVEDLDKYPVCRHCAALLGPLAGAPRPVARRRSHAQVCAACGDSVLNRRTCVVDLTRPGNDLVRVVHKYLTAPHCKGADVVKVCYPCRAQAMRSMKAKQCEDIRSKEVPPTNSNLSEAKEADTTEPVEALSTKNLRNKPVTIVKTLTSHHHICRKMSTAEHKPTTTNAKKKKREIELLDRTVKEMPVDGYYRVQGKRADWCAACERPALHRLKLTARQQLMLRRKLYVSSTGRVCDSHRKAAAWPDDEGRSPCVFTREQIADMVFLLKEMKTIDFGNVEKLDPFIVQKWLGITLEQYQEILQQNSVFAERADGKFALAVFLASEHTGECDAVLASACGRAGAVVAAARQLAAEHIELQPLVLPQRGPDNIE